VGRNLTRAKNSLAGGSIVAPASSPAGKSGVPPRVFGLRTGTVLELAAATAALRCGCQTAPGGALLNPAMGQCTRSYIHVIARSPNDQI